MGLLNYGEQATPDGARSQTDRSDFRHVVIEREPETQHSLQAQSLEESEVVANEKLERSSIR